MNIPEELKIMIIGANSLSEKAKTIDKIDDKIINFGHQLIKMMTEYDGIGLAANQVGVTLRIIALGISNYLKNKNQNETSLGEKLLLPMMPITIINPKIIHFSEETNVYEEGCLSVPGIFADVERPSKIIIEGIINFNNKVSIECGGFLARVLQHEIDHLNATLFVDRLSKRQYAKIKPKLEKLKIEAKKNNYIRKKENAKR